MRVTVSVHGRFHGFDLARELHRQGHLAGLLTTYPRFAVKPHVGDIEGLATAPALEVRRRVCQRLPGLCKNLDETVARRFGRFAADRLPPCDLLVGWSSATLEAIPAAHAMGACVILERGSTHIMHQTDVLTNVYSRAGQDFAATSAQIVARELAEYEAADAIAVPSSYAAQTFIDRGVSRDKVLINPYGVNLEQFSPAPERRRGKPRILFVGRVGYRKGVPELLDAFAPLADLAELHLVGPIDPLINLLGHANVHAVGALSMQALPGQYHGADIFCLPSWEEGFPLVLLQAMASGLPVVASDATGAADIITDGVEGVVVPAGDKEALGDALRRLVDDPDRRMLMGQAARARVQDGFGWADYGRRAIDMYTKVLAGGP